MLRLKAFGFLLVLLEVVLEVVLVLVGPPAGGWFKFNTSSKIKERRT